MSKIEKMVENIVETDELFLDGLQELENEDTSGDIQAYSNLIDQKKIIRVYANRADDKGNLFCVLNGNVVGIMKNEEVEGKPYDPYYRAAKIDKYYNVIVTEVDESKQIVYLSYVKAKDIAKDRLRQSIITALNNNENPRVKAIIKYVHNVNNRVMIDIGGVGILGYIPAIQWKHGFEYNLDKAAKVNTVVEVEVIKYQPKKGKYNENFICSRKNLLPDPWIGIEEKMPVNSVIVVTCIERKDHNFFGRVEGLPDIDIYCEYPDPERKIHILEGMRYKGFIYNVSEKNRLLKARVFQMVTE